MDQDRPTNPLYGFSEIRHEHSRPSHEDFDSLREDLMDSLYNSIMTCRQGLEIHHLNPIPLSLIKTPSKSPEVKKIDFEKDDDGNEFSLQELTGTDIFQDIDDESKKRFKAMHNAELTAAFDVLIDEEALVKDAKAQLSTEDIRHPGAIFTGRDRKLIAQGLAVATEHMAQRLMFSRHYIFMSDLLPAKDGDFAPDWESEMLLEEFFAICPLPSRWEVVTLMEATHTPLAHLRKYFDKKSELITSALIAGEVIVQKSATVSGELIKNRQEERLRFDIRMARYGQ